MKKLLLSVFLISGLYLHCAASGYQVLLQGNRQTGMGNLGVALRPDASSLFFNPGAMAMMDHNAFMAGTNPIFSHYVYWNSEELNSDYTTSTDNPLGTPFHVYGVWGPADSKLKFGVGAFTPFGSTIVWGEEWLGRDLLNELGLKTIVVQPTVAYKILDNLSFGAGLDIVFGDVTLKKSITALSDANGEGRAELEGKANTGFGFNAGLFYSPSEKFDIGISYRSKVVMKMEDGDAKFTVPSNLAIQGEPASPDMAGFPVNNKFDAELPLPSVLSVGVTYKPTEKLDVGVQFDYVGWGAYDSLVFDFKYNTSTLDDSRSPRRYENSYVIHVGGEYRATEKLQTRLGFYYDKTPVQDGYMTAETPDNNRIGLTAGLGYSLSEHFQVDVSFLYIHAAKRQQTEQMAIDAGTFDPATGSRDVLPGTYRLNGFIPGISLTYKF